MLIHCLLGAKYCSKKFTLIVLFSMHSNLVIKVILSSFYRWGNWGTEFWRNMPSLVTQFRVRVRARIWILPTPKDSIQFSPLNYHPKYPYTNQSTLEMNPYLSSFSTVTLMVALTIRVGLSLCLAFDIYYWEGFSQYSSYIHFHVIFYLLNYIVLN